MANPSIERMVSPASRWLPRIVRMKLQRGKLVLRWEKKPGPLFPEFLHSLGEKETIGLPVQSGHPHIGKCVVWACPPSPAFAPGCASQYADHRRRRHSGHLRRNQSQSKRQRVSSVLVPGGYVGVFDRSSPKLSAGVLPKRAPPRHTLRKNMSTVLPPRTVNMTLRSRSSVMNRSLITKAFIAVHPKVT